MVLCTWPFGRGKESVINISIWRRSGGAGTPHSVEIPSLLRTKIQEIMKAVSKHKLREADILLFEAMEGKYSSVNEKNFFKNLKYKQECEVTALNDLLVSEYENDDEIYLIREYFDEYVVGHGINSNGANEKHVMCLAEALSLNLKEMGFIERDLTLLQWLRECDFEVVNYERNYDLTHNG